MALSREIVKTNLVHHGAFLKSIIRSNDSSNTKLVIKSASRDELNAVGYVLASIAQGLIPMKSSAHSNLKQRRKLSLFRHKFESPDDLRDFMKLTKYEKELILISFAPSLPYLLRPLVTKDN